MEVKRKWVDYLLAGVVLVTVPFAIPAMLAGTVVYFTWRKKDGTDNSPGTEEVSTSPSEGQEGSNHSQVDSDGYG